MNKNETIEKIYNFKKVEILREDLNYRIEILNNKWLCDDNIVLLDYFNHKFYISIEIENQNIKIGKNTKAHFKELKNGNFQLKINKQEAKNLASLIFTALNILKNEL